ncbi:MAG: ATP-binding protein [Chloroflexi bacterium]|nr:ATP-binding protein [Chloroflexota bacterium]
MEARGDDSAWIADEREITRSIVQDCAWLVTIAALVVLAIGGLRVAAISYTIFGFFVALALVSAVAHGIIRAHTEVAALVLAIGTMLTLAVGIRLFPQILLSPWLSICVLLTCSMLGWRAGVIAALLASLLLIAGAVQQAAPPLSPFNTASIIGVVWSCVALYWLISRPTRAALGWAFTSYQHAVRETERARERQADLARLSKTLTESNYRLQQLNIDLERARRAAQEAVRLKTQFATAVSHELRTPLNLIIGFCEMMVLSPHSAYGEQLPPSYQHDLEVVYRNACHISALVDDILDLSQIEADRMALQRDWYSLPSIIKEAVRVVESLFHDRGLWLRVHLPPATPPVYVDKTRMRQILINLLSNAARVTDRGGATVRLKEHEHVVRIQVEDTGPGIPPDDLRRVFEEFQQSRLPGGRRGGTGLGLTVSRHFAELHGGTLTVVSTLGQGSIFTLELPLQADEKTGQPGEWLGRADRAPGRKRERVILVLDPSRQFHRLFQRYIDGYRVLHASTLASARLQLKRRPVQAIVVAEAGDEPPLAPARLFQPDESSLPFITCSFTPVRLRVDGHDTGVRTLLKPVTRESLALMLRSVAPGLTSCLIVDDEEEMRLLLERMVRSLYSSCRTLLATSGEEAIEVVRREQVDIVLLDVRLGGISGREVAVALRNDAVTAAVPVVLVTGFEQEEEVIRASQVALSRSGGLPVGELMRCLSAGLEVLLG